MGKEEGQPSHSSRAAGSRPSSACPLRSFPSVGARQHPRGPSEAGLPCLPALASSVMRGRPPGTYP